MPNSNSFWYIKIDNCVSSWNSRVTKIDIEFHHFVDDWKQWYWSVVQGFCFRFLFGDRLFSIKLPVSRKNIYIVGNLKKTSSKYSWWNIIDNRKFVYDEGFESFANSTYSRLRVVNWSPRKEFESNCLVKRSASPLRLIQFEGYNLHTR